MGIRQGEIESKMACLARDKTELVKSRLDHLNLRSAHLVDRLIRFAIVSLLFAVNGCSAKQPPRWDEVARSTEYYRSSSRTQAPEPVYGRMTWSHLPEPQVQRNREDAPLIDPKFSFEMPNSNLEEAIEALSQSIGYRWEYPQRLASRKISINMIGTVSAILQEICKQAHVRAELDNKERIIHVQDASLSPKL